MGQTATNLQSVDGLWNIGVMENLELFKILMRSTGFLNLGAAVYFLAVNFNTKQYPLPSLRNGNAKVWTSQADISSSPLNV